MRKKGLVVLACVLVAAGNPWAWAGADWPQYGADAARSQYTPEALGPDLTLRWVYKPRHGPRPAWPRCDRIVFDRAQPPVIAGGTLYFGSSADGKVYALDAASGKERWSFFTGGPVRCAPAAWRDQVFAASDDGYLYCLSAKDGELRWRKRGGPGEDLVLGNERLISRWPARGGPAVLEDTVYFGAGLWPAEGIYLYALEAATGKVIWDNGNSGALEMNQPHPGAKARSGISAQGHLVAAGDALIVPTGRGVPALFGRADGKFRYFWLQQNSPRGGSAVASLGGLFFNRGCLYDTATGSFEAASVGGVVAALPEGTARFSGDRLRISTWVEAERKDASGKMVKGKAAKDLWTMGGVSGGISLIAAGKTLVSGGRRQVTAVDVEANKVAWSAEVDGDPYGLAAAGGRLYVSTDKGTVYCFGPGAGKPTVVEPVREEAPYGANATYVAAAQEILTQSGVKEGYCVDLACGDGALAFELARNSNLRVYGVEADEKKVNLARSRLDAAGLYGVRVTIHPGSPEKTPYPRGFANLVVSGRAIAEGAGAGVEREALRLLRPYGGAAWLGKAGALSLQTVRGAPEGAGSWTHQYADAANTCCSTDTLAKAPLGMLWFADLGVQMPQRHGRGPAPLFSEGRLFVEGLSALVAVDAYNGRRLWEFPLGEPLTPYNQDHLVGTAATASNYCVAGDSVYLRTGKACLRLEAATGRKLGEHAAPPRPDGKPAVWGYLACADGTLLGSLADEGHTVTWTYLKSNMEGLWSESVVLFAMDPATGKVKWTYPAKHSLRHNAIAAGGGRVYVIDRPKAEVDRIPKEKRTAGGAPQPTGELLALDAATGKAIWRTEEDVYGTLLALSLKHDVLLMSYQPSGGFTLPSERSGRMSAFRASDGKRLWEVRAGYVARPLINDRTICAQPGTWDLLTGEKKPLVLGRSYGCGIMSGSSHLLLFRSATLGFVDLLGGKGTENYGGIRPGCWINVIPAGGLVLMPDATDGCGCSYLNKASIALQSLP